ncbi:hypothetical protein LCGC14_1895550 [marine sediment metagenome]|uniref:Uncharacterized protein n=1 Tax=marine sediment metagenome TaxID=412755 RepID=A0A0F9GLI7_9ZZZZ
MKRLVFISYKEGDYPEPIWAYFGLDYSKDIIKIFSIMKLKIIVIFWDGIIYDGFLSDERSFPLGIRGDEDGFEYYLSLVKSHKIGKDFPSSI